MTAIRRRNIDRQSDERAMAATGGGKIRSRRYHIASKPYAKSKQQSGLISRVTDTVKSIVPSWLQKYFKNGDTPAGQTGQGTEQNCQPTPPPAPPNGNEEGPPPIDGRYSPEPSTSNTEPSTSRASLNFQEYVLSRPPLSRSHLHFTPLDASSPTMGASSSLFSPPSTSSAPGPFSTGFSLVKEIKDNLSQHEDDNISTTSGFSSRASDKDVPTSKTASLPQLWSPEMDRTNSGPQQSQSSLKKPSFNLSVFGNSSNSTLNSTLLNSSQLGDSPFYPGKTTYGGAAAVRSSRGRPGTPYQAPVRRQIKAKPAGAQPCGVTSATARRILQSLERMSSPLADAKRIPAATAGSPSRSPSMDILNQDGPRHQAKKKRMDSNLPPVQKLVVPAAASVSGNRSVSFRPTLTPGGLTRALDRTPREKTPTRQSPQLPEATPGPSQSTPAASSLSSGGGKIRRERTTARPSSKHTEEDEVAEAPVLPSISLPINKSSLPTFSFSPSLPPAISVSSSPSFTSTTPAKETLANKDPPKASTPPCAPFTFSSPIVKATAASPPSYSPAVGFTFSAPVAKLAPSMSNGNLTAPTATAVKPIASKSTEEFVGPFKPAKTLKQGSVLDLLKSPGFASPVVQNSLGTNTASQQTPTQPTTTPSPGTSFSSSLPSPSGFGGLPSASAGWSCDVCLVQNKQSEIKCVCCQAPKPNSSPKSAESKKTPAHSAGLQSSSTSTASASTTTVFGPIFSKPAGTWECDTCLVLNKSDAVKCVACETAKPGTGLKPSLTFPPNFSAAKTASTPSDPVSTGISGFGDKFKKPEGAWECETCLVQNKAEDTKCVACTASKPGASAAVSSAASSAPTFALLEQFKKPEGSWECDTCMVQNKAADVKCVACQTTKPGATVEPKALGSFGSSAAGASGTSTFGSSTSNPGGFKFGTSDSTAGSGSFKFGTTDSSLSSSSGGFKFGASFGSSSSESSSKDTTASSGFKFGGSSEGFKFGAASNEDKKSDQPAAGAGLKFGGSSEVAFGSGSSSTESNSSSKSGFTFGLTKSADKTPETTTTSSSSITLTPLTSSRGNSDKAGSSNDTTSTNTTTATAKGSVFGRLGDPNVASGTPQVSSTFGSLQAGKEPAAPTFAFGKPEEKKEAAPSTFVFGAVKKEPEAAAAPSGGGFSFSKPSAPADQPPPAFTFGKQAEKSETSTSEASKPSFSFGQTAADSTAAPKPAFSFLANNPPSATTSSSATPTPAMFGAASSGSTPAPDATSSSSSSAPSTFVFGQPSSTTGDAPPAKNFMFGQNHDNQSAAPSSAPLNPAQPFIFGASANAASAPAPAAPSFTFGAPAAAPPAASSSAPSAAPSPFVFSSAPSGGFGANQNPPFASGFGSPFPANPTQTFGAKPNAAPTFGQQNNATPVFGSSTNSAPSGGFQFGGASAFGASNNSSGVFTFGPGAGAPSAPSANPPIAPQSGAAGGSFNFTQTPAFNIGSAKTFTASPAGQSGIAGRKIKTAVRRRK
ncbi:nuclear pore complex protein Nup153 isoform X2 [Xiphophorus couchianus]|uniref:nuclear pore complex protein Nup153 isoform X2 n=1 Tax=Xiphophorus couchianus TaxID=32473 RepID=UPI001016E0AF|nr:nuclear pore complex protein Nup153 isoform X2 [Xiphophorus couchianus]